MVKKENGLKDGETSEIPAGTQTHMTGHSSESSAQELKIFLNQTEEFMMCK